MWGKQHTYSSGVVLLLVAGACSFDTSVSFQGAGASGGDGGLFSPDAGPAPDAEREFGSDAANVTPPDAAPEESPEGTLRSFALTTSIELDGELDAAWMAVPFVDYAISDSEQLLALPAYGGDATMRFASLHDSENLYFFFEVKDDLLVNDSSNLYNDDSIELYLDGNNDRSGPYGDDDHWLVIANDGNYQSLGPGSLVVSGFIKTTAEGYNIEIAVAQDDLGMGAGAALIGFNLGLNDDDDIGDSGVDAYGLWHLPAAPICSNCCTDEDDNYAWCDTTRFGQLQLMP